MNPWSDILEFITVSETGSFTRAAQQLNTATAQISRAVSRLEKRLGIRLLHRTTRKLTLTEAGVRYRQSCQLMMRELNEAEQDIAKEREVAIGTLRINISGAFQDRAIVSLITHFLTVNPDVSVSLVFNDRYVDPVAAGFDVSICHSPLPESSYVARHMATVRNVMVAAPAYLAARGSPRKVDDLKHHNCIVGTENPWLLSNGSTKRNIRVQGSWQSDNINAILSALRHGVGIAQLHDFNIANDIKAGTLVEVLPAWNLMPVEIWCMTPGNKFLPQKTRRFVDYIKMATDEAKKSNPQWAGLTGR